MKGEKGPKKPPGDYDLYKNIASADKPLTEKDTDRVEEMLQKYLIPVPEEEKIQQTIHFLTHIVRSTKGRRCFTRGFTKAAALVVHVMKYSNKWYFGLCLLLYVLAMTVIVNNQVNPYVPMIVLGPVPFLLAVAGAFRIGRIQMAELEMSFKYSLKQLMMAKFLLAAILNTMCNAILSFIALQTNTDLNPTMLTLFWCMPFMVISSISLHITITIKNFNASLGCLGAWSGLATVIAANPEWVTVLLEAVRVEFYVIVTIASGIISVYAMVILLSKTIGRGDFLDTYAKRSIKAL